MTYLMRTPRRDEYCITVSLYDTVRLDSTLRPQVGQHWLREVGALRVDWIGRCVPSLAQILSQILGVISGEDVPSCAVFPRHIWFHVDQNIHGTSHVKMEGCRASRV